MAKQRVTSTRRKPTFVGGGGIVSTLLNKAIDALPIELHLPNLTGGLKGILNGQGTYSYCGPGTKLAKRLARGDPGINGLDEACKAHDIAYSKYSDSENRRIADKALAERAWQRFKSSDASLGEKAYAWLVTTAMKAKTAIGGGKKRKRTRVKRKCSCKNGKGLYLRPYQGNGSQHKKKKKRAAKKKNFNPAKTSNELRPHILR